LGLSPLKHRSATAGMVTAGDDVVPAHTDSKFSPANETPPDVAASLKTITQPPFP